MKLTKYLVFGLLITCVAIPAHAHFFSLPNTHAEQSILVLATTSLLLAAGLLLINRRK